MIAMREFEDASAEDIAKLPAETLLELQERFADKAAELKGNIQKLGAALDIRYNKDAKELRLATGREFGIIHIYGNDIVVDADFKKEVKWDQEGLRKLRAEITECGNDPDLYISSKETLTVREVLFDAWPPAVKNAFLPYRTVTAKPSYKLTRS